KTKYNIQIQRGAFDYEYRKKLSHLLAKLVGHRESQQHADQAAGHGDEQGFAKDHARNMPVAESHGLEDGVLADAFAGSHGHGIGHHSHDDNDHDIGDDAD